MNFTQFNLSNELLHAIEKNSYTKPTAIQEKVIPLVLDNEDIIAMAQTGSGKTASYVLPILEFLSNNRDEAKKAKIKVLILTPTRELSIQVSRTVESFTKYLHVKPKVVTLIGGESIGDQLFSIQQGCDILVATSGRFIDIISKKQMNLSHVEFFVLDEADKMLSLGFEEELDAILEAIPSTRRNLLFSATYPPKMQTIAQKITTKALHVEIKTESPLVDTIEQRCIEVNTENRAPLLRHLLKENTFTQVLVFMANKRATDNIAVKFRKHGLKADSFHGDLTQEERNYTMDAFRAKKFSILFTTDISARGLDISGVDCVINFDLPRSPTDYIHRIGRTARAGKSGVAISFISHDEQAHFKIIEKKCKVSIKREQIEGFELSGEEPKKTKGSAPIKGKGKSKKDKLREKASAEAKK